ncbi:MAG TPA: hypothetical protein VI027_15600 [Rubrobacteraceae bacterium]
MKREIMGRQTSSTTSGLASCFSASARTLPTTSSTRSLASTSLCVFLKRGLPDVPLALA